MTDHLGRFVLVLRPGPDPLVRRGQAGRADVYRLRLWCKRLLRELGFAVVSYHDLYPTPYLWTPGEGI